MCRFIETLRADNGRLLNVSYHNNRLNNTRREVFGALEPVCIEDYIKVPPGEGRIRCRLTYGREVEAIEYFPYRLRPINSLKLVAGNGVDYHLKYADRSVLDRLFSLRDEADDVLIVRNGRLTDTSIANVAFWDGINWCTPQYPLLKGTRRAGLLKDGLIIERDIKTDNLNCFLKIRLFNAMIDFGEVELNCNRIVM